MGLMPSMRRVVLSSDTFSTLTSRSYQCVLSSDEDWKSAVETPLQQGFFVDKREQLIIVLYNDEQHKRQRLFHKPFW